MISIFKFTLLPVLILYVGLSGAAKASTEEMESAPLKALGWQTSYANAEKRLEVVKLMLAYWEHYGARVPRLSPAEDAWLTGELGGEQERLSKAINSREYALREVGNLADSCAQTSRKVIEAQETENLRETEMFHWAQLVKCYDDFSEIRGYLQTAGLIEGSQDKRFSMLLSSIIHDKIIDVLLASAMADTMDWTIGQE